MPSVATVALRRRRERRRDNMAWNPGRRARSFVRRRVICGPARRPPDPPVGGRREVTQPPSPARAAISVERDPGTQQLPATAARPHRREPGERDDQPGSADDVVTGDRLVRHGVRVPARPDRRVVDELVDPVGDELIRRSVGPRRDDVAALDLRGFDGPGEHDRSRGQRRQHRAGGDGQRLEPEHHRHRRPGDQDDEEPEVGPGDECPDPPPGPLRVTGRCPGVRTGPGPRGHQALKTSQVRVVPAVLPWAEFGVSAPRVAVMR